MDLIILLLMVLVPLIITFLTRNSKKRLPPGPYGFPIIGNILQIGQNPHQSLAKLSQTYGSLMSLKLGSMTTIVVSSPEIAKIVLQTNDSTFASRTIPVGVDGKFSLIWLPSENRYWRKLRKLCKEQMFSASSLDATSIVRDEKLEKLRDYIKKCSASSQVVNIGAACFTTTLNMMSSMVFSMDFAEFESDSSQEMKEVIRIVLELAGSINYSDYFPVIKNMDLQGIAWKNRFHVGKLFAIFDGIIDRRMDHLRDQGSDFLGALLDVNQKDDSKLSRMEFKHLLVDLFVAGTDTTAGTVEWAMAELLNNPDKMSKLRSEIIDVVGVDGKVQETDISRLPFLQAVVKETLRLHPGGPLLLPHKAGTDVEIKGYTVPQDAQILVNVWAIGRDSNIWPDANLFIPERFLDGRNIDFRGNNFELIPFGAGRRICPGLPLAYRVVHLMLVTLVHKFEWKIEGGFKSQQLDMSEKFGLSLRKTIPLKAVPINMTNSPMQTFVM